MLGLPKVVPVQDVALYTGIISEDVTSLRVLWYTRDDLQSSRTRGCHDYEPRRAKLEQRSKMIQTHSPTPPLLRPLQLRLQDNPHPRNFPIPAPVHSHMRQS